MADLVSLLDECVRNCLACYRVCMGVVHRSLEKANKHVVREHVTVLVDCAEICKATAGFLLRESGFGSALSAVCADICRRCAASCDELSGDEEMARCASVCRVCADSCRRVAATPLV